MTFLWPIFHVTGEANKYVLNYGRVNLPRVFEKWEPDIIG